MQEAILMIAMGELRQGFSEGEGPLPLSDCVDDEEGRGNIMQIASYVCSGLLFSRILDMLSLKQPAACPKCLLCTDWLLLGCSKHSTLRSQPELGLFG
jgi:hypothetical protein